MMVAVSTNEICIQFFLSCEISHLGLDGEILTFFNNYLTVDTKLRGKCMLFLKHVILVLYTAKNVSLL